MEEFNMMSLIVCFKRQEINKRCLPLATSIIRGSLLDAGVCQLIRWLLWGKLPASSPKRQWWLLCCSCNWQWICHAGKKCSNCNPDFEICARNLSGGTLCVTLHICKAWGISSFLQWWGKNCKGRSTAWQTISWWERSEVHHDPENDPWDDTCYTENVISVLEL